MMCSMSLRFNYSAESCLGLFLVGLFLLDWGDKTLSQNLGLLVAHPAILRAKARPQVAPPPPTSIITEKK